MSGTAWLSAGIAGFTAFNSTCPQKKIDLELASCQLYFTSTKIYLIHHDIRNTSDTESATSSSPKQTCNIMKQMPQTVCCDEWFLTHIQQFIIEVDGGTAAPQHKISSQKISFRLIKQASSLNPSVKTALLLGVTSAKASEWSMSAPPPSCWLAIREDLSCTTHKVCPLCIKLEKPVEFKDNSDG